MNHASAITWKVYFILFIHRKWGIDRRNRLPILATYPLLTFYTKLIRVKLNEFPSA